MHFGSIRTERRRAVEREPQHQPAVEESREQHAAAFVSRRNHDGLNDVPEGHRSLDVGRAQPRSSLTGAGGDALRNQYARSREPRFETPPMHGAVLPGFQSLARPGQDAELVGRQEGCRGDDAAVFTLVSGAPKQIDVDGLEALPDDPAPLDRFLSARELPEFGHEPSRRCPTSGGRTVRRAPTVAPAPAAFYAETGKLRQVVEQPGLRLAQPQALLEDGRVGFHHAGVEPAAVGAADRDQAPGLQVQVGLRRQVVEPVGGAAGRRTAEQDERGGAHGVVEQLEPQVREVDDGEDLRLAQQALAGLDGIAGVVVQETHGRQEKRDDAVLPQMPQRLPDEGPRLFAARRRQTFFPAPFERGMVFAAAARPGRVADDHVGRRVVGLDREEVLGAKRLPMQRGEHSAPFHQRPDVRRGDLFEQRDVQREHGHADGAAVHVPPLQPRENVHQVVPGDLPVGPVRAPVFAQALEQAHQEDAGSASRIQKAPAVPDRGRQPVPRVRDGGVGQEHRGVVGAQRVAVGTSFGEKPVVDGADQLDRNELEVVPPEAILPAPPAHLLAAGTKAGQDLQVRGAEARAAVVGVERARGEEQIAVEVLPQRSEKAIQRLDVPGPEQRFEVFGARVRDVPEVLGAYDLPVLEIGDEHRLHQQRLRRVGGQAGVAKLRVRLREVAEKNPVHALFRPEVVGMLLPVAARFGGVDEVAERKRVGGGAQFLDETTGDGVVVSGTRDAGQRKDAHRIPGEDDEQTGEALVPERGAARGDGGGIVLVDGEEDDRRHVLHAEDGRPAQVVQRRAQRAGVRHVADVVRRFVELRRDAGGKTQAVLPDRVERFRRDGLHQGCPGAARPSTRMPPPSPHCRDHGGENKANNRPALQDTERSSALRRQLPGPTRTGLRVRPKPISAPSRPAPSSIEIVPVFFRRHGSDDVSCYGDGSLQRHLGGIRRSIDRQGTVPRPAGRARGETACEPLPRLPGAPSEMVTAGSPAPPSTTGR